MTTIIGIFIKHEIDFLTKIYMKTKKFRWNQNRLKRILRINLKPLPWTTKNLFQNKIVFTLISQSLE